MHGSMRVLKLRNIAVHALSKSVDETPIPARTSVYQTLSDSQITNIHDAADALFNVLDRNGDNSISEQELASHLLLARYTEEAILTLFQTLDVDSDGSVSRVELREAFVRHPPLRNAPAMGTLEKSKRAAVHVEADKIFAAINLTQDGLLSLQELEEYLAVTDGEEYVPAAVSKIFKTLDGNSDGSITPSEFRGGYVRYRAVRLALSRYQ